MSLEQQVGLDIYNLNLKSKNTFFNNNKLYNAVFRTWWTSIPYSDIFALDDKGVILNSRNFFNCEKGHF